MNRATRGLTINCILAALVMAVVLGPVTAEARMGDPPSSQALALSDVGDVDVLELAAIDPAVLITEDQAKAGIPGPLRFALPVDVKISTADRGTWQTLADGSRLWRLRVHAPNSTDLNFGFGRYEVPEGTTLHILSEEHDFYQGPYTAADNRKHGQLWTPVVPGERAIIELRVPARPSFTPELVLTRIGCGYRDLFSKTSDLAKQGSCNNDVICPEGDPWRNQIRSVAVYGTNGSTFCTGTMIMDVPGDFRPFFLTANHCGISSGNAASVVVYWNFESPTCGALSGGTLSDSTSGATFRASNSGNDMCLIELDSQPDSAYNVYWSGWDATGDIPSGSVGIHHPNTDEKAITFNTDPLTTSTSCIGSSNPDTHWRISEWEDGTTEPGSSGSGLWDPDSKLLIGYLSGGSASCSNMSGYDCYGRFSVGWGVGLSTWLDPAGTGTTVVQGSDPQPQLSYAGHSSGDTCAADAANENGVWEPGETISLVVSLTASGNFSGISGTLSSSSPGVSVTGNTATWPSISSGASADSTAFTVVLSESATCLSDVSFDLQVTANEGGPFDLVLTNPIGESLSPDVPKPISDNASVSSTFVVGQDVTLTDLDVRVEIDHTWVGDLDIVLQGPDGTQVVLLDRPGVDTSGNGCSDNNMDVTFDSASGTLLEGHCAGTDPWYTGTAAPVSSLDAFNGLSTSGTWTLVVTDSAGGDTGTLQNWELLTTPALGAGQCTVCSGVGPGDLIFDDGFESGNGSAWSNYVP